EGTLLIIEIVFRCTGEGVTAGMTFETIPAGWDTVITGADNGTEDTVRWGVFSRLMTDTEDESWDWGFPFPANALYVYRVFEGEDLLVSEAAYLAQASSNTSRISPTIETEVAGVVCYST